MTVQITNASRSLKLKLIILRTVRTRFGHHSTHGLQAIERDVVNCATLSDLLKQRALLEYRCCRLPPDNKLFFDSKKRSLKRSSSLESHFRSRSRKFSWGPLCYWQLLSLKPITKIEIFENYRSRNLTHNSVVVLTKWLYLNVDRLFRRRVHLDLWKW